MLLPRLQIACLLIMTILINPWTIEPWADHLGAPHLFNPETYTAALGTTAAFILDIWALLAALFIGKTRATLFHLLRSDGAFLLLTFSTTSLFMLATNPILAGKFQWLRLALPLINLWLLAKLFHLKVVKAEKGTFIAKWSPVLTSVFAILGLLLTLEGVFMFVAKSQLNDNALASKVWFERHWQLNSGGYRDSEDRTNQKAEGRKLVFLGDSFLAGHGVKDTSDRFSNRIQAKLGQNWRVYNFGQNGANAEADFKQLISCSVEPELFVLCWFVNDIQGIVDPFEPDSPKPDRSSVKPPLPISLVHGSYFFNYLYMLFPAIDAEEGYLDYLHRAYTDPGTMEANQKQLLNIKEAAYLKRAKFAVVLFPMLNLVRGSEFALEPMRKLWQAHDVPFLDLSPIYSKYKPEQLTVNAFDSHPNELAHLLAADAILEFLQKDSLLDGVRPTVTRPMFLF